MTGLINLDPPTFGGGIMSAGGVHFIGSTIDRVFRAFDVATGEMLWDDSLSADAKAAPLSYELTQTRLHPGDRQYTMVRRGGQGHCVY